MAIDIPTTEPTELTAGDSWQWRRDDLADFPASVWSLTYAVRNVGAFFDINATPDGDAFAISVAPATTAAIEPGKYQWFALVTDGTDRHTVGIGTFTIKPDVAAAAAYDARSLNQRMLDAVNAILEQRASADQLDLVASSGGGMSATRDIAYLRKEQKRLEVAVKREQTRRGGLLNISARLVR